MNRNVFRFLLLFAFVFSVSAQKAQVAKVSALQADLRKHIEYLASDKLAGRRTGEPGARLAAAYVADQFAKLKLRPGMRSANGKPNYMQAFPYTPKAGEAALTGYNIIGVLEGRDKVLKNEAIVIGAHYDHLGYGGEGSLAANSTEIHHGADDNASGTAAIIELARQFAKAKNNKRTIIFIAFSGEEEGLFGSKFYVNNPVFPVENTIAMFNLDMVGRLHDEKLTIGGIGTASEWKLLLTTTTAVRSALNTNFRPFTLQLNEDGFGPSDHSSFYTKKIPVLFFFTGTHLDYHKPSDTADKINYDGEEKVIAYVAALVKAVDQNAVRPTYTVAKSSGTPGGRSGFSISLGTIPSYTDSTNGMVIDGVRDDSPASRAGMKANDKIVKLAGTEVRNVQDYTNILGTMKAGQEYEIVVVRGAETLTLKIIPVKRP
jgi:Zn-dependent M28 family amino/carboxypeptidase